MIGGHDVTFASQGPDLVADIAAIVLRHWRDAHFQVEAACSRDVPPPATREFFAFRDGDAARSWDEHGAVLENRGTMLHFLVGAGELTVVHDEMHEIITELMAELT